MTHTLQAKEQPLLKIFSDEYVFTIPGYQRPYSWTAEQARDLIEDLTDFMHSVETKLEKLPPYFLGSIVLIKGEASPDSTVVDGQQRLTTLTLLLSAIRASISDSHVKAGLTKRIYEQGDVVTATANHYRLSLRERDLNFFRNFVQHEGGIEKLAANSEILPDSQDRLRENARLFLAKLEALSDAQKTLLSQFIVTKCYLVTVTTPDLDSAYRIFGVLNSRGLDLTATDILKAEIIGHIADARRDMYTKKWEDIEDDLGRDSFGELFGHIRMVYRKMKPKGTLLKEFHEHVDTADPIHFIDTVLQPMSLAFEEITDGSFSSVRDAERINACLRWLNRLEFKDWLPPALVFFSIHRNDPDAVWKFVADLERLAYSMLVRRSGANERIDRFASLTKSIEDESALFVPTSPLQLSHAEQYATYEALAGPLYDTHAARARTLILLRLDELVSGGGATYDYDTVTVEHVLPQTPAPGSSWSEWFSTPAERVLWVHRLGNLALLTRKKNSAASNFEFGKKKTAYFTKNGISPFALTTQVLQHHEWLPSIVAARQYSLLEALESHWRLNERKSPAEIALSLLAELDASGQACTFELESAKHGLQANARVSKNSFIVLKGSLAKPTWTSKYHSYQTLHQRLIDTGILVKTPNGVLAFNENTSFKSPSAAAAVILGRPENGTTSWILKGTTQTYAAWFEMQGKG